MPDPIDDGPMTEHEEELLEYIGGLRDKRRDGQEFRWGAAMSVCVEYLHGRGFIRVNGNQYQITEKGKKYLAEKSNAKG